MLFTHTSLVQEGEAALFYRFDRKLNGYMIAGVFINDTVEAKLNFAKIWTNFVSEVVQADDIYCSIPLEGKQVLYALSLSAKSIIIFILPFIIFVIPFLISLTASALSIPFAKALSLLPPSLM